MPFFKKLKQKIAQQKITRFQEKSLVIFSLVFLFAFFTPHIVSANVGEDIVSFVLKTMLKLCGLILSVAETLFAWIIVPDNMTAVIDNEIIYATWRVVRDFFNIAFILVLLFSAFATIFQASSNYNYKKVLLNLVIMALLVNFSYPIARFLIDVSNVIMYGILNGLGGSNSFMEIIRLSGLAKIFGAIEDTDLSYLLMLVIFTFIFAITLLVIAVLLVIRTITLALYVIFSPIAFIGSILPGTALASASSDWWKDFIKQCFAGPTIVFMLFISTKMVTAITLAGGKMQIIATEQAGASTSTVSNIITTCSFFALPIIILWLGIIEAQKSGIAGAKEVVGYGTKAIKWGQNVVTSPTKVPGFLWKSSGVPGGAKEGWKNFTKTGKMFGMKVPLYGGSDQQERMEARFGGLAKDGFGGWGDANVELERKKVIAMRKEWKDQGAIDQDSVYEKLKNGTAVQKRAAALEIAENHKFNDLDQYKAAVAAVGNKDKTLKKIFDDKVKDKHVRFIIENEIIDKTDSREIQAIYDKHLEKLNNEKFAAQDFNPAEDEYIKKYIEDIYVGNPADHQNVFSKLKGEKKKDWNKAGLAPAEKTINKQKQSSSSYVETQSKRAKKAQNEINKTEEFKNAHEAIQEERASNAQEEINKNFTA